ncbi:MAG: hypothetical protein RL215_2581 [Planctomycetota bacterium]
MNLFDCLWGVIEGEEVEDCAGDEMAGDWFSGCIGNGMAIVNWESFAEVFHFEGAVIVSEVLQEDAVYIGELDGVLKEGQGADDAFHVEGDAIREESNALGDWFGIISAGDLFCGDELKSKLDCVVFLEGPDFNIRHIVDRLGRESGFSEVSQDVVESDRAGEDHAEICAPLPECSERIQECECLLRMALGLTDVINFLEHVGEFVEQEQHDAIGAVLTEFLNCFFEHLLPAKWCGGDWQLDNATNFSAAEVA